MIDVSRYKKDTSIQYLKNPEKSNESVLESTFCGFKDLLLKKVLSNMT